MTDHKIHNIKQDKHIPILTEGLSCFLYGNAGKSSDSRPIMSVSYDLRHALHNRKTTCGFS